MSGYQDITKILFVDNDNLAFQIRQCAARAIFGLPPLELFHANDANEALATIEQIRPDVVVLDSKLSEEIEVLIDNLGGYLPSFIVQTDNATLEELESFQQLGAGVTCIANGNSLDSLHSMLLLAASIAQQKQDPGAASMLH